MGWGGKENVVNSNVIVNFYPFNCDYETIYYIAMTFSIDFCLII